MAEYFDYAPHFMVKAVRKAGIDFPITKAEALTKAGDIQVRVDFEEYASLYSIIESMIPEDFPTGAAFYNAYVAAQMKLAKIDFSY